MNYQWEQSHKCSSLGEHTAEDRGIVLNNAECSVFDSRHSHLFFIAGICIFCLGHNLYKSAKPKINMQKRGAVELSFSTIVILVLAMTMLILGLILIKSIFSGATYNVDQLNKKVEGEINKLFQDQENREVIVYLPDNKASMSKGGTFGVAFGIKYIGGTGTAAAQFTYQVKLDTDVNDLRTRCGISETQAMSYILEGKSGSLAIRPENIGYSLIRISVPKDGPVCLFRYQIEMKKAGVLGESGFFDLEIK